MFTVEFPYNIGTFVRIKPSFERKDCNDEIGTISCYNCVADKIDCDGNQFCMVVSGYKESWCGEYLLQEIEPLTDEEIEVIKNKYK